MDQTKFDNYVAALKTLAPELRKHGLEACMSKDLPDVLFAPQGQVWQDRMPAEQFFNSPIQNIRDMASKLLSDLSLFPAGVLSPSRKSISETMCTFEPLVRSFELEWTVDFDTMMVRIRPIRDRYDCQLPVPEFRIGAHEFLKNPRLHILDAHDLLPGRKPEQYYEKLPKLDIEDRDSAVDKIRAEFGPDVHIEPDQDEDGTINGRFL